MLSIDPKQQTDLIVRFIKSVLLKSRKKRAVIALSGGIDSATSLMLLVKAIGVKNVLVVNLPFAKQDIEDAHLMIGVVKISQKNIFHTNIKPAIEPLKKLVSQHSPRVNRIRLGNIMVRTRMIFVYDCAKVHDALVCGTENRSEFWLGYFTLFGDSAADFVPLQHLYKTQVYALAKYLGVPQKIINKKPSAGLWPGQTDEKELGFTYEEADKIMYWLIDKKLSRETITHKGFSKKIVNRVLRRIAANRFKHQIPYTI